MVPAPPEELTTRGVLTPSCAGTLETAATLGFKVVGALYTHRHWDHGGGSIPKRMTGGADVRILALCQLRPLPP